MSKMKSASAKATRGRAGRHLAEKLACGKSDAKSVSLSTNKLLGRYCVTATLLLCCLSNTGCQVYLNARRTLFQEPSEFCWKADRKRSIKTYQVWADGAWCRVCREGNVCRTIDYEAGFKDGFVDFVYAGGDGSPPPVPPRRYWNLAERNDPGHESAAQWFAGFRHGAQVAKQEGYRDRAIVHLSAFYCSEPPECPETNTRTFLPGGNESQSTFSTDASDTSLEHGTLSGPDFEEVNPLPLEDVPLLEPEVPSSEYESILPDFESPQPQRRPVPAESQYQNNSVHPRINPAQPQNESRTVQPQPKANSTQPVPARSPTQAQPRTNTVQPQPAPVQRQPEPALEPAPEREVPTPQEDELDDLFGLLQEDFQVAPTAAIAPVPQKTNAAPVRPQIAPTLRQPAAPLPGQPIAPLAAQVDSKALFIQQLSGANAGGQAPSRCAGQPQQGAKIPVLPANISSQVDKLYDVYP